ncbi:MAG: hypothetical protein QOJ52_3108 [Acidimicrobiaceae bacterium]|nr:hypothetical protein [Acidimicrobiaceae bacterium]
MTSAQLDPYLRPTPFAGEALRFDLSTFRSVVTREMLQVRLRMTAQAFGVALSLVAANLTDGGTALEVDAAGLMSANSQVRSRIDAGPDGAVVYLRRLAASRVSLDRRASAFASLVARGGSPSCESFVAYVLASADYQALGALKFCLPETLRPTLAACLDDVDALLSPEAPSLWSTLSARELALARLRFRGPAPLYQRRLEMHRRAFGYLFGEDVDFQDHETLEAIDARIAGLGGAGPTTLVEESRRLARSLASDRTRKAQARSVFADYLAGGPRPGPRPGPGPGPGPGPRPGPGHNDEGAATLLSHVLLARALTAHEDLNRRAKMRFLRDLRDVAATTDLELQTVGLLDLHAALRAGARQSTRQSARRRDGSVRPVLRSI